jgi:ribulose-5-phosphate 4-epimerase/fuculose-1-phosphate aldolase
MNSGDIDEGYVKYQSDWLPGPPPDAAAVRLLDRWRRPLFDAGLVGHSEAMGVGFGNISIRGLRPGEFVITGTQTGRVRETTGEHYARVTRADIAGNRVECSGPVQASSEALTHAALYRLSERINAVVHVHSRDLWARELGRLPATAAAVPYGTPAMAREFERLWRETAFPSLGLAVMAGHDEGLVSFGTTLPEAAERLLSLLAGASTGVSVK